MRKKLSATLALLSIVLLVGCAGTMNGMVRSSGETFKGKVVMVGRSSGIGYGFGTASATTSSGGTAYGTGSAFTVVKTYTGNMQGVLFGDRGHTMRCSFQYAASSGSTTSGGVGVCETSDGRVIDVQW